MSSGANHVQNQMWAQLPTFDSSWGGLPTELFIMPELDHSMLANSDLLYNHNARQNTMSKNAMDVDGPSFWGSNGMNNLHRSNLMPSPEADILLSPMSPFSDTKHTYSPVSDCDQLTPGRCSASYTTSPGAVKVSLSPSFVPSMVQSRTAIPQQTESTLIQNGFGLAVAPAVALHTGKAVEAADNMTQYSPERSHEHSQSISPGMTPWYPPGYTNRSSAMIQSSPPYQFGTPPTDHRPNSFLVFNDRNLRQRQAQWSNTSAGVPTQSHFQTRFMAPSTADTIAQRKADDETLLQMKQDGYTYKDIRKALRHKVAESTLRGRYRSLTKPRKQRVRRPEWTEIDVSVASSDWRLSC